MKAAVMVATGQCTMQYVQSADSLVKYRLSRRKEDRSIAEIATDHEDRQDTKIDNIF